MFIDFLKLINSYQNSGTVNIDAGNTVDVNQYVNGLSEAELEALCQNLGVSSIFDSLTSAANSGSSDTFSASSSTSANLNSLQKTLVPIIKDMLQNLKTEKISPTGDNGKISIDDIKKYLVASGEDENVVSQMSEDDLNAVYNYLGTDSESIQNTNNQAATVDAGDAATETTVADAPQTLATGGGTTYTPSGSTGSTTPVVVASQTQTSDDLKAEKAKIIQEYDGKISTAEQSLASLMTQTDSADEAVNKANDLLVQKLSEVNTKLTASETQINTLSANVQKASVELNSLQGEYDNLDTNSQFSDVNQKNEARKSELTTQIANKKAELAEFQKQLEDEKSNKTKLEQDKNTVQGQIDKKLQELEAKNPELKAQIDTAKETISNLKAEKESKINEIDKKIEEAEKTEKEDATTYGSLKGYEQSGITAKMLEYATSPELKAYWDNWYAAANTPEKIAARGHKAAYCAMFVSDCVEKTYKQAGISLRFGRSVGGIRNWGEENNSGIQVSGLSADQRKELVRSGKIKPGMAFTYMENGRTHTGFIKSINSDFSWETIEGNTQGGTVASNTRDIYNTDLTSLTDWTVRYSG